MKKFLIILFMLICLLILSQDVSIEKYFLNEKISIFLSEKNLMIVDGSQVTTTTYNMFYKISLWLGMLNTYIRENSPELKFDFIIFNFNNGNYRMSFESFKLYIGLNNDNKANFLTSPDVLQKVE